MRLTAKTIDGVHVPSGKDEHFAWDDELPGFGLRVRSGGSRIFVLKYRVGDKQRRMTLGPATKEAFKTTREVGGVVQLGVRERVAQLLARVKLGEDPAGEKIENRARASETFEAVGERWLAKKLNKDKVRPGTYRHIERHILRTAKKLHPLAMAKIGRRTVAEEIDAAGSSRGPVAANRLQATLSELFTWAMSEGYCEQNPLLGRDTFEERPRERVLEDDELRQIWQHAGDDHFGDIVRLLMLSGQRADEIAGLRRSEITKAAVREVRLGDYRLPGFEVDVIDLPPSRTKNRRRHLVPISPAMQGIIDRQALRTDDAGKLRDLLFGIGQRGFSGWSRCKARLDERIHAARVNAWQEVLGRSAAPGPLPHWTPHDLRRTLDTQLNDRFGIVPHVVEALLNHVSSLKSGKAGVAGTYNHAQYLREKTEALRVWSDHITALVGDNVVPLRRAE